MKKLALLGFYSILCLVILSGCWCGEKGKKEKEGKKEPKKIAQLTNTGLKYKIVKEAPTNASIAKEGQKVTVHYTGWLDEKGKKGKKVDSTLDRNQKFSFQLGQKRVIRGFDEGIASMKVGEKRQLTIPPHLAYGKNKVGDIIPENATLIFDVELLEVA